MGYKAARKRLLSSSRRGKKWVRWGSENGMAGRTYSACITLGIVSYLSRAAEQQQQHSHTRTVAWAPRAAARRQWHSAKIGQCRHHLSQVRTHHHWARWGRVRYRGVRQLVASGEPHVGFLLAHSIRWHVGGGCGWVLESPLPDKIPPPTIYSVHCTARNRHTRALERRRRRRQKRANDVSCRISVEPRLLLVQLLLLVCSSAGTARF